jgi:hypothetical protein
MSDCFMRSLHSNNEPSQVAPIQKKSDQIPSLSCEVIVLAEETKALFTVLDSKSKLIRDFELCMSGLKAHFPFRYPLPIDFNGGEEAWFLGWEQDDSSQKYRLFLISQQEDSFSGTVETLTKKPLIETTLDVRLRVSEHVVPFISAFKDYLKKFRVAIEPDDYIPF